MSGKMILYKLVVLGDGGVGKVGLSRPLLHPWDMKAHAQL